jgi:hypothetical protein
MATTQRLNELLVPLSETASMAILSHIFMVYLTTLVAQTTYYQMLRWTVNNKLERTWKEAVRASFPVLLWYLHVAIRILETSVWTVCDLPNIWSTLQMQVRSFTCWANLCTVQLSDTIPHNENASMVRFSDVTTDCNTYGPFQLLKTKHNLRAILPSMPIKALPYIWQTQSSHITCDSRLQWH